jgi:multiple sugar transport system permease protein
MEREDLEKASPDGQVSLFRRATPYLFLIPVSLLIAIFLLYPIGNVFYYSFQNYNPTQPFLNGFAGFDNFIRLFTKDPLFYHSLFISIIWVLSQVSLQLMIGLITALLLNQKFFGRGLIRGALFTPWAISGVVVAIMWSMIFNEHFGLLNDILLKLGLIKSKVAWVASTDTALFSVIIAELWRGIPFFAISLLAALQLIPGELYESCSLDGGGWFVSFVNITLPFLKKTIILSTLLRTVWEFKSVDIIYNLTSGGPVYATNTLSMYLTQQAISLSNFGYGSAIAVTTFVILALFAVIYLKLGKFMEES